MEKLDSYYQHSAESDAHIMAMGDVPFLVCFMSANPCVIVLDPMKKMSHFHKHWPSHLVHDVEEAIQIRVWYFAQYIVLLPKTDIFDLKFLKCFNVLQNKPYVKSVHICKTPVTYKPTCPNINDTNTEDDSDCSEAATIPANAGMDEWQAYLSAIEELPDGLGIVQWWGVCGIPLSAISTQFTNICSL